MPEVSKVDVGAQVPSGVAPANTAIAEPPPGSRLGLALSGGGSRAAAFHRGTIRALAALGLLEDVDVVSTVSGGSLFGGAWMAARARGETDDQFLAMMADELERGFIRRSLRPNALRMFIPGHTRTAVMADTFDRVFFHGATLKALPERPRLCLNTTVLNDGQVGKFSREGFRTVNIERGGTVALPEFKIALAVAASAAFPIGLPPVLLSQKRDLANARFSGPLERHHTLALSDGGVLENLGVQTLLRGAFRTWNLVVSDAGARQASWRPGSRAAPLKAAIIALFSGGALDQVMLVMNDKQNRWMREGMFSALDDSYMVHAIRERNETHALHEWLKSHAPYKRRHVLFVRVNRKWRDLLSSLAKRTGRWKLLELWERSHPGTPHPLLPHPADLDAVETFLADAKVDVEGARKMYRAMGGDEAAEAANHIRTNFTALTRADIELLAAHAEWQVHATHALFG